MAIVPIIGLILNVSRVDSDTTSALFWRFVDVAVVSELGPTALCQNPGDSSSQCCFAVINVSCR